MDGAFSVQDQECVKNLTRFFLLTGTVKMSSTPPEHVCGATVDCETGHDGVLPTVNNCGRFSSTDFTQKSAGKHCSTSHRFLRSVSNLVDLPPELLLVIFSFLEARFTLRVLPSVCQLFYELMSPESSWKTRFAKKWPHRDRAEDYNFVSRFVQIRSWLSAKMFSLDTNTAP